VGIEMLHLTRSNTGLRQRQRPSPAAHRSHLRARRSGDRRRRWCHNRPTPPAVCAPRAKACSSDSITSNPAPSPITKPSRPLSNGRDASLGGVVVAARQCPRCRETGKADPVDRRLRPAAHGNIRFAGADQSRRIANRLNPGGARSHRRAQRALQAVLNRHVAGCEIDQKRRDGERRQTPRTTAIGCANSVGNRAETTDTRPDDRRGTLLVFESPTDASRPAPAPAVRPPWQT
jgi:hypothetical protein